MTMAGLLYAFMMNFRFGVSKSMFQGKCTQKESTQLRTCVNEFGTSHPGEFTPQK